MPILTFVTEIRNERLERLLREALPGEKAQRPRSPAPGGHDRGRPRRLRHEILERDPDRLLRHAQA